MFTDQFPPPLLGTDQVSEPIRTPMYDRHVALGAKMAPFAGFEMPIQYAGILAEHEAVRTKAGIFDLSHMGEFELSGPDAAADVQRLVANDAAKLDDGGVLYTPMCREDGTIVDDLLVYRFSPTKWMLVVNASNVAKDRAWVQEHLSAGTRFADNSLACGLVALQGPEAEAIMKELCPEAAALGFFTFVETEIKGMPLLVSRTGYTGEDGFEIYCSPSQAAKVWDLLAADERVSPIGLGARDSLRFEAKLMLYGNDIDDTTNPIEATIAWTVKLDGDDFIGRDALLKVKEEGPSRKLVGLEMVGRGIPRHGYEIFDPATGEKVGYVTSGCFSPTLKKNLGLGYVRKDLAKRGNAVNVQIRKNQVEAEIVKTPFYKRG